MAINSLNLTSHCCGAKASAPIKDWLGRMAADRKIKRVLIRVDAGREPGLSFGHLSRCLILSDILKETRGVDTYFLMADIQEGIDYAVKQKKNVNTAPRSSITDEFILAHAKDLHVDLLIVDLPYDTDFSSLFSRFREENIQTLFIDDARFFNPGADIYLNSSILAAGRVTPSKSPETQVLLGPEYFIFAPSFEAGFPISRTEDKKVKTILLTFGGSDPKNLTKSSIDQLLKYPWNNTTFHIIIGPGYGDDSNIKELISGYESKFIIFQAPEDIIPFFMNADFILCAGGRTMYELACLGREFIPLASTEFEAEAVTAFVAQGWIPTALDDWSEEGFCNIVETLRQSGYH